MGDARDVCFDIAFAGSEFEKQRHCRVRLMPIRHRRARVDRRRQHRDDFPEGGDLPLELATANAAAREEAF